MISVAYFIMHQIFSRDEAVLMNRLVDGSPTKLNWGQQIFDLVLHFLSYEIQPVLDTEASLTPYLLTNLQNHTYEPFFICSLSVYD